MATTVFSPKGMPSLNNGPKPSVNVRAVRAQDRRKTGDREPGIREEGLRYGSTYNRCV